MFSKFTCFDKRNCRSVFGVSSVSSSSAVCPDAPEGHFRASSASWSLWEVKAWKKGGCECPEVCAFQGREVGSEKRLGSASSFRAVGGAGSAWHCGRSCHRFRLCFFKSWTAVRCGPGSAFFQDFLSISSLRAVVILRRRRLGRAGRRRHKSPGLYLALTSYARAVIIRRGGGLVMRDFLKCKRLR